MKKRHDARNKALLITILYLIFGCVWILLSDWFIHLYFSEQPQVFFYSEVKGIFYVLVTSVLIFCLTYPALKAALDGKEALRKANEELKKSSQRALSRLSAKAGAFEIAY